MNNTNEICILLIENKRTRSSYEVEVLQRHGFTVILAYTVDEALNAIEHTSSIEVVLMDIHLDEPYGSVYSAKRILDEQELPIMLLVDRIDSRIMEKSREITHYGILPRNTDEWLLTESLRNTRDLFTRFKQKERESRFFLDASPDIYVLKNREFQYVCVNKTATDFFETEEKVLLGKTDFELLPASTATLLRDMDRLILEKNEPLQRVETIKGRTYEIREIPVTENKCIIAIAGILRDVTEQHNIEDALKDREALLSSFFDSPGAMRGILEEEGENDVRRISVNTVTADFFGTTTGELNNRLTSEVGVPEEITKLWLTHYRESKRTGKPVSFTYRRQALDETPVWLSVIVNYIGESKENKSRFAYVVYDITEHKQREEELKKLVEENRQLLTEINHRVSNNLANIEALARIELSYTEKSKEDSINDIISRIEAINLVHTMLYAGKSYSGINLEAYLNNIVQAIYGSYRSEGKEIQFHYDVASLYLPSKQITSIGIITAELLTNSFKYACTTGRCSVSITVKQHNDHIMFSYCDNGKGFDAEVKDIEDIEAGTGILLIRELVSGLDGEISLHTKHGTEFRIVLPVSPS